MDEGAESGDRLAEAKVSIYQSDDTSNLYERVTQIAIAQLREFVPRLAAGEIQRIPQEHRLANVWRKRGAVMLTESVYEGPSKQVIT